MSYQSLIFLVLFISPILLDAYGQQGSRDLEAEYCINNWARDPVRCAEYVPKDYEEKKAEYKAQELQKIKQETSQSKSAQESQRVCPFGSHIGKDNFGNQVCLDSKTNEFVSYPNTGQDFGDIDNNSVIAGIVIFIVILAIIVGVAKSRGKSTSLEQQYVPRRNFSWATKEMVKIKQGGRCANCGKFPTHWEFHHVGSRDNNDISNCKGLCHDCHDDVTY